MKAKLNTLSIISQSCRNVKLVENRLLKRINGVRSMGTCGYAGPSSRKRLLQLQMIKAIVDSRSFKSPKSDEPRRVQVLDLYCLTRFESKGSSKGIVYKD